MFDKSLFNKQEVIAVALSGGKDSVCLAHLLHANAKSLGITVKAINVEHGIRGESSLKDTAFVKDFCKSLGIELKCYAVNVPEFANKQGFSEEQAGRILRYQCFDNALIEGFCDKIATAHHLSDNAETVLFNLLRGSALAGVCGIKNVSDNGKIIRPLLNCLKSDIDNYIKQNDLPFVHDESNDQNKYTRNFIRNELFPLIESRFEGAERAINRFSSLARQDEELLNALSQKLIKGNSVEFTDDLNKPLFSRACLSVIKKLGVTKDFESAHLDAVYNLKNSQSGKSIDLKNGVKAYKSKNAVVFEKQETGEFLEEIPLKIPCEITTPYYEIKFEKIDDIQPNCLCFDGDKLPYNAVIRTKRTGDRIKTFGGSSKSLKKFFTDKKIDARISKHAPVIAVDSEIYAVCPVDISYWLKVDKTTKKIIKLTCKRKGE